MKIQQQLDCNIPLTSKRLRLQRIGPQHVELLLDSFGNDSFWNTYRINQPRDPLRDDLLQQLQFEYERLPEQVGKIEWLIERLPERTDSSETLTSEGSNARPIGLASLSGYDSSKRQAEFLIGFFSADDIVTGMGLEASLLALSYAFNNARFERLLSYVYAGNTAAQASTLALGFSNNKLLKSHLQLANGSEKLDVFANELTVDGFRKHQRLSRLSIRLLGYDATAEQTRGDRPVDSSGGQVSLSASFKLER